MIFRRKKQRLAGPEAEIAPTKANTEEAQTLGNQALRAVVAEGSEATNRSYAEELRIRMRTIDDAKDSLIREALANGVEEEALPALVADAMNSGTLSRIVRGISFRGGGFRLYLLDGQVPSEALSASVYHGEADEIKAITLGLTRQAHELAEQSEGTFSIYVTPYLLRYGHEPIDQAMLDRIDAHMVMIPSSPPQ